MPGKREIVCVQPGCARRTKDFYVVQPVDALATAEAVSGETCAPCYEDIIRRGIREESRPFGFDGPDFRRPEQER